MLTQEEFMDVLALKRQGLTNIEIARELGYHPATVAKWLAGGGPPRRRRVPAEPLVDERWATRIAELLRRSPKLLATSVFEILLAEGFGGSYPTVARHLRELRGPRFKAAPAASVPIVTAPGEEAQFDFSDVSAWTRRWGLGDVVCFQAILSWSRYRLWWFTTSEDQHHTFEGLVRFFEAIGGVPRTARTDRMGALGASQGRRFKLHPPAGGFAAAHGTEIRACQAGDAARKGKVERPYRDTKERFLAELDALGPPISLAELNDRGERWLEERVHSRVHRSTKATPLERLGVERSLLGRLPRRRFDTAYIEPRRVHVALPFIEWRGVRYSVPPTCLGQRVEVRCEVDGERLEIRWAGELIAGHRLAEDSTEEVWDATHFAAAQHAALRRHRRRLALVLPGEASPVGRLSIDGDYEVAPLDLGRYAPDDGAEHPVDNASGARTGDGIIDGAAP